MKVKLLLLTAVIAYGHIGCSEPGNNDQAKTTVESQLERTSKRLDDPVEVDEAKEMIKAYLESDRYGTIDIGNGQTRPDTRAVTFDSAFVRKLYEAVQCEKASGIRIYFGIYTKPQDNEHLNAKTVIFTTTYDTLVETASGEKRLAKWDNLYNTCAKKQSILKSMPPENKGGLCPPPNDSCSYYGALLLPEGY